METHDEKTLIQGCLMEDKRSMELFYKKYFPVLYPVAARYARDEQDAKSLLNGAMMKIFQALPGFNQNLPLAPWMKTIVVHAGIDHLRARKRNDFCGIELTDCIEVADGGCHQPAMSHEEVLLLLRKLPEILRTVLTLFAIEEYSHQEIAQLLGISEIQSRQHLFQARRQVKSFFSIQQLAS